MDLMTDFFDVMTANYRDMLEDLTTYLSDNIELATAIQADAVRRTTYLNPYRYIIFGENK